MENSNNRIVVGDIDHTFEKGDKLIWGGLVLPYVKVRPGRDEIIFGDERDDHNAVYLTKATLTDLIKDGHAAIEPKYKPIRVEFEGAANQEGHIQPAASPDNVFTGPAWWRAERCGDSYASIAGKHFRVTIEEIVEEDSNG